MQKNSKKCVWFALSMVMAMATASAQQAAPSDRAERRSYISAAAIADMMVAADAAAKSGKPFNGNELLGAGYYRAVMQYLTGPMKAYAQHQDEDELFVVIEGAGEIILGAKLINPHPGAGATTLVADAGEGGIVRKLSKGDMFFLPAKSSRFVTKVDGKLVMMSMRLPLASNSEPAR